MEKLRVIGPGARRADVASGVMLRQAAISGGLVGAEKLWMGWVELGPGLVSGVHHHGDSESGIFVVSGRARFCSGEALDEVHEAGAGDFVWVPPHLVHVEVNMSTIEPVLMVVARSTQEAIVVDVPAPAGWSPSH
ncbi:MAG: cupin domain-containing protein [Actinomycetota bacterium]|nr:cupin domain-containing protein [Actinomycetota bacterium]